MSIVKNQSRKYRQVLNQMESLINNCDNINIKEIDKQIKIIDGETSKLNIKYLIKFKERVDILQCSALTQKKKGNKRLFALMGVSIN